jgi:hypothetical protein
MMTRYMAAVAAITLACAPEICLAQQKPAASTSGQAAYAAIGEIVGLLEADSTTDWSKVNIEALRQHLIDMDEVTMRAAAEQRTIPAGIEVDVTGTGRTLGAIRRMVSSHALALAQGDGYDASAKDISGGVRLVVTAKNPGNAGVVARIRGLGFAGLMTVGDHHARHHLVLARGEAMHGH